MQYYWSFDAVAKMLICTYVDGVPCSELKRIFVNLVNDSSTEAWRTTLVEGYQQSGNSSLERVLITAKTKIFYLHGLCSLLWWVNTGFLDGGTLPDAYTKVLCAFDSY